jgi:ABC-type Fe3+ transport system permease subunit
MASLIPIQMARYCECCGLPRGKQQPVPHYVWLFPCQPRTPSRAFIFGVSVCFLPYSPRRSCYQPWWLVQHLLAVLPSQLHYTAVAIVAAHAFFNIAVVVRVVGAQWEQLSLKLSEAARTLGVSPLRAFATITLPLLRGSITAASVVVGLFSFTSYGVVRVLGGPARSTIETEIYTRAVLIGDLPGALALSIGQMLVLSAGHCVVDAVEPAHKSNGVVCSSPNNSRSVASSALC